MNETMPEKGNSNLKTRKTDLKPVKVTAQAANSLEQVITNVLSKLSNADVLAAKKRVQDKKANYQNDKQALIESIIKEKVQQTALVGAASSSASLIPGLGTLASLTVGAVADVSASLKLQSEMVLELAAAYDYPLSDFDQQKLIFLVTGVSTGSNALFGRMGREMTKAISERYAKKWFLRAIPIVGVATATATNALTTYLIAARAKSYFEGESILPNWQESLKQISKLEREKLRAWLQAVRSAKVPDEVSKLKDKLKD